MNQKPKEISDEDCELSEWDIADQLDSEEKIAAYLEAAAEENNPDYMTRALNNVVRARRRGVPA